jgi:hypothetical protein
MRKHTGLILGAIGFATGLYLLSRSAQQKSVSQARLTTTNLDYKKVTYRDLASENLTDLNRGDASELRRLGLSQAFAGTRFEAGSAGRRVRRDSRSDCGGRKPGSDQGRGLEPCPSARADDGQPSTLLVATK